MPRHVAFYQWRDSIAGHFPGLTRQAIDVNACFAPLLGWVLEGWPNRQLPIALDASNLGDQFVVLAISVVYRGCSIPVAWRILPATLSTSWRAEWVKLLEQFKGVVPEDWTVLALTDRGLVGTRA